MIKLSNYLLPINAEQEVTIDLDGGIVYEGKIGDCDIPLKQFRQMEVINVFTGNSRVDSEIIIETRKIVDIK